MKEARQNASSLLDLYAALARPLAKKRQSEQTKITIA